MSRSCRSLGRIHEIEFAIVAWGSEHRFVADEQVDIPRLEPAPDRIMGETR